jgi:hypothetical protein
MYFSSTTSLLVVSVHGAGWKEVTKLLKLALLRAKGFSKHLKTPRTNSRMAAANNLLSAEGDHEVLNT